MTTFCHFNKVSAVVASSAKAVNSIPRLYGCDAFIKDEHGEETPYLKRGKHKISGINNKIGRYSDHHQ